MAWVRVTVPGDEPIVNTHIATIEELNAKIAKQCVAKQCVAKQCVAKQCVVLADQPEQLKTRTGFHWWPMPINPN